MAVLSDDLKFAAHPQAPCPKTYPYFSYCIYFNVRTQMVDFASEQGLSDFETAEIVGYFEDFKRAKTQLRAKRCCFWMIARTYIKIKIRGQGCVPDDSKC